MSNWSNEPIDSSSYSRPAEPVFDAALYPGQQRRPANNWLWPVGLACGCVGCGCLVGALTLAAFFYFSFQTGMNLMMEELREPMSEIPSVQTHLGELESASIDWAATTNAGEDVFVYHLIGSKDSGNLYVHEQTDLQGNDTYEPFLLILSDGRRIEIREESFRVENIEFSKEWEGES